MKGIARTGRIARWLAPLMVASLTAATPSPAGVAPRPPMGWNSWDAYGFTITEAQFRANVGVLAGMKRLGWRYAVIDEGWYMGDPLGRDLAAKRYRLDAHGRLVPVPDRFPSGGGASLRPLADWTHAQGLRFGIHIVRGIPKAAVDANMPIEGSRFHAADAADHAAPCPWDDGNYGVADNAAGQAWYDSLLRQYAGWGVDFLKVDCIADHPYRPSETRQIGTAIARAGRPMVLSLSPGPARLEHEGEMAASAQMWRIADDLWDGWTFPHPDPASTFPNGIRSAFDNLALWQGRARANHWPDADMLPLAPLRPHPGWGDPRASRWTAAEARTAFTLWAIARSPLILGGNLTELDAPTRALLANADVIALDQQDRVAHPVEATGDLHAWTSAPRGRPADTLALFNVGDVPLTIDQAWTSLGVARPAAACELWSRARLPGGDRLSVTLPPRDVRLYRMGARC